MYRKNPWNPLWIRHWYRDVIMTVKLNNSLFHFHCNLRQSTSHTMKHNNSVFLRSITVKIPYNYAHLIQFHFKILCDKHYRWIHV